MSTILHWDDNLLEMRAVDKNDSSTVWEVCVDYYVMVNKDYDIIGEYE